MEKKPLEQRNFEFEIRTDGEERGIITGRPIVYESVADMHCFDEVIKRGALGKTDLRDVRFLVNHDLSKIPLARSRNNNGNSTMHLTVDDMGMAIRVQLDVDNNAEASSLYSAVKRGDISGMSFMFSVDGESWENLDTEHPTRSITSIGRVVEVSAVTFPAYDATTIQARDLEALESAKLALESAKRNSLDSELELEKARFIALQKARY